MNRLLLALLLFLLPVNAIDCSEEHKSISVNNRVLATVNGKAISVVDVMKKLDMILYQQYPQYLHIPEARYQFYQSRWKMMLSDLIDRELVVADAEEKKFELSSGDVREELEEIFGPAVMENLERVGLSFSESWQMVRTDIIIRRMLHFQVRSRVYSQITAQEVKKAYDEYVLQTERERECTWCALSIKEQDKEKTAASGQEAYQMLTEQHLSLEQVAKNIASATLSSLYTQKLSDISPSLLEVFSSLKPSEYSKPIIQVSRSDQTPVARIYYIQAMNSAIPETFQEMGPRVRENIAQKRMVDETENYFAGLRKRFRISKEEIEKNLPQGFTPFEMR